jgi:two-component system, cell cycle sensor histidine kinase and response regulator CckA
MKPLSPSETVSEHHVREIAHDFNNLLTAMIGAADAVLRRSEIDPESRADIANMREGAHRGAVLIRRLQLGSEDPPAAADFIYINETIRATSRLLAHRLGSKIVLTLELAEPDSQVRAEPAQLDRVLLNLIANARHAIPASGIVTLRTECRTIAEAEQRVPDTVPCGNYVVIAIADTGTGMLRDEVRRIFDPGLDSPRDTDSSGLGLSSVRQIVRQCGGFLAVESVKGHGTCFEIFLPRGYGDRRPEAASEPRPLALGRVVLLVDDDLLVRRVVERVMRRAGWTVRSADSGEIALAVVKESSIDLMISDIRMHGMDGLILTRLALAWQPDLPVILTSGYEFTELDLAVGNANVTFLPKPYGQTDLLAAVARSIGEQAAGPPPRG